MKPFLKKIVFLAGGVAAVLGFNIQPIQAAPVDSTAKIEGVSEKTQLILTQTSYAAGQELGIQNHYSHSSHESHASHHSHYSGR